MGKLSSYAQNTTEQREVERLANGDWVDDATTARTLALSDTGQTINMTSSSANTVTIPPNASVAFRVGAEVVVCQGGTGATSIVAGSGVTIEKPANDSLTTGEQYASVLLKKRLVNTWWLCGRTT